MIYLHIHYAIEHAIDSSIESEPASSVREANPFITDSSPDKVDDKNDDDNLDGESVVEESTPIHIDHDKSMVKDGDWSIHVSTLTALKDGDVAVVAYGEKGELTENSGQIILGAPPGRPIFQDGNEDEFRVCIIKHLLT
ncbi:retinal rod cell development [Mactra antiquata]